MISATPEQTEFTGQIHKIALDNVTGDADFEPAWKRFPVEFQHWTTQCCAQNTSGLNVKLGFLQMLLKHFPSLSVLKTDPRVIDLVLAGCRTVVPSATRSSIHDLANARSLNAPSETGSVFFTR